MRLSVVIRSYGMDEVVLDMGSEFNVMAKQTWEIMAKPKLTFSPIQLSLANQQRVSPLGRLSSIRVDLDGVRSLADFEVIEIIDDNTPYPALLGIDWAFLSWISFKQLCKKDFTLDVDSVSWHTTVLVLAFQSVRSSIFLFDT